MSPRHQLVVDFRRAILATLKRMPVSVEPPEGTLSAVDNGTHLIGRRALLLGKPLPAGTVLASASAAHLLGSLLSIKTTFAAPA